jgi:hypothetical protein
VLFLDESDLIVIGSGKGSSQFFHSSDTTGTSQNKGYVARITYNTDQTFPSMEDIPSPSTFTKDQLKFPHNGETNFSPCKVGCNGKEMRRIMCILDADMQRFKVLDIGEDDDGEILMDEIA